MLRQQHEADAACPEQGAERSRQIGLARRARREGLNQVIHGPAIIIGNAAGIGRDQRWWYHRSAAAGVLRVGRSGRGQRRQRLDLVRRNGGSAGRAHRLAPWQRLRFELAQIGAHHRRHARISRLSLPRRGFSCGSFGTVAVRRCSGRTLGGIGARGQIVELERLFDGRKGCLGGIDHLLRLGHEFRLFHATPPRADMGDHAFTMFKVNDCRGYWNRRGRFFPKRR